MSPHLLLTGSCLLLAASLTPSATVAPGQNPAPLQAPAPGRSTRALLRVLVPAYFYPGLEWARLTAASQANPGRVHAIGNPFNGPGLAFDANYEAAFTSLRSAGGSVLGYVHTTYGDRPIADVKADIDLWTAWYDIDGIFIDEMDNVPGADEPYYLELFAHVRARIPGGEVVGNPGTNTSPSYLFFQAQRVSTALCIYEGRTGFLGWSPAPWTQSYDRRNFYVLPYNTPQSGWQASVDHAFASHCGWVYATDDDLPNPWDTLPPYFEAMVAYISSVY